MADRYGIDQESYPYDASGAEVTGSRVLVLDAWKRLTTPEGACWWDPTGTEDITALFLAPIDRAVLPSIAERMARRFDADPRAEYEVDLAYLGTDLTATVTIAPIGGAPLTARIVAETGALEVL